MPESTTTQTSPTTAPQPRRINPVVVDAVASLLSKSRSWLQGESLRVWAEVSPEEQADLLLDAMRAINGQDPTKSRKAHDIALERAEQVLDEEGKIASAEARNLARRIAAEAILAHRLALQGTFGHSPTATGGVQ
jgi:hypothetical protein